MRNPAGVLERRENGVCKLDPQNCKLTVFVAFAAIRKPMLLLIYLVSPLGLEPRTT
jgi:hypothetical protein